MSDAAVLTPPQSASSPPLSANPHLDARKRDPKVPDVDPQAWLTALQVTEREYGDQAVLGDPFTDKNGVVFAEVTRHGKHLDWCLIHDPRPFDINQLYRKGTEFRVSADASNPEVRQIGPSVPIAPGSPVSTLPVPAQKTEAVAASAKPKAPVAAG